MNVTAINDERDLYMRAYMEGYAAALRDTKSAADKPYIDKEALIERYDGKIGLNKALGILRSVRQHCNGGKLNHEGLVLRSELEYWESEVDKKFKERL